MLHFPKENELKPTLHAQLFDVCTRMVIQLFSCLSSHLAMIAFCGPAVLLHFNLDCNNSWIGRKTDIDYNFNCVVIMEFKYFHSWFFNQFLLTSSSQLLVKCIGRKNCLVLQLKHTFQKEPWSKLISIACFSTLSMQRIIYAGVISFV